MTPRCTTPGQDAGSGRTKAVGIAAGLGPAFVRATLLDPYVASIERRAYIELVVLPEHDVLVPSAAPCGSTG